MSLLIMPVSCLAEETATDDKLAIDYVEETAGGTILPAPESSPPGWSTCYGGSGDDYGYRITESPDGGYTFVGTTGSNDGDVSGNHGMTDIWLAALDRNRMIEWGRSLGGSNSESGSAVAVVPDGGYIVTGMTDSDDGDVSGNNGGYDLWIARTDDGGNLLWQTCMGGPGDDSGTDLIMTADDGYLVTGWTTLNDQISGTERGRDAWIIKFDSENNIEWELMLGGQGDDVLRQIIPANDGGYIAAGGSDSDDGTSRVWVVKLSEAGHLIWEKLYGGAGEDGAYGIAPVYGTGYLVAGYTGPAFVAGKDEGSMDASVIKITNNGTVEWEGSYGGSGFDRGHAILFDRINNLAVVAGETDSSDGDVNGNHGNSLDLWAFALDTDGNLLWQKCLGGSATDSGKSLLELNDGYLFSGYTYSNDYDVSGNHGGSDLWTARIDFQEAILPPAAVAETTQVPAAAPKPDLRYLYPAILIVVIAIIVGLAWYLKFRSDPGSKANALALLDELRFTIRRLGVRGVVIPDQLKEIDTLERQVKERRFEWAILELTKRIRELKGLEESFDRAHNGMILLEADNSRLREKGVVFEDRLDEINRLFTEGSYDQASESSQDTMDKNRTAENKHDAARENLAALTNELDRIRSLDRDKSVIEDYWEEDQ